MIKYKVDTGGCSKDSPQICGRKGSNYGTESIRVLGKKEIPHYNYWAFMYVRGDIVLLYSDNEPRSFYDTVNVSICYIGIHKI